MNYSSGLQLPTPCLSWVGARQPYENDTLRIIQSHAHYWQLPSICINFITSFVVVFTSYSTTFLVLGHSQEIKKLYLAY